MANQSDITQLASAPVGRLLWTYSLPAVVGMLVMALYNVVDRIFVGQVVGPEAIAGLALTFPLMNITTAIGVLVGVGSATRVSIQLGRKDFDSATKIMGNALTLTLVNAAAYITVFCVWIDPILRAFGAGDITLPYAREYMLWVMPGLLMTNVAFGFNNLMRASGYPNKAMMTMLIGAITNVVLDAVFVLWLDWGMRGAALATDIAMCASSVFVMQHFFVPSHTLHFRRGTYRLDRCVVLSIITIGAAPSVVNVASCLINAIVNRSLVAHGGDMAIGAAGVFVTYTSLLTTIILGINMGLQPIIGYNFGAGLHSRLAKVFWLAVGCSTVISVAGSVFGLMYPELIARAFTKDEFLVTTTVNCLRLCLWAFGLVGFQIIATCLFQSIGAAGSAIFLSLTRQVIFLLPLLVWLPGRWGVDGVWLSFPISDIFATVVTAAMVRYQFRAIRRRKALQQIGREDRPGREEIADQPLSASRLPQR